MSQATERPPRNWKRRAIGVAVCFSPFLLLATSIAAAAAGFERPRFAFVGFVVAALLVAMLNFYLSSIRPLLLIRRHGSLEGIPHVSGFPLAGTVLVLLGGLFGFGAWGTALFGLLALVLDTGGLPWFLISTWGDSSMWDAGK